MSSIDAALLYKDLNLASLQVETNDGFLLSLQHIPHGKNGVADNTGPPVFLQHGLFQVFSHYNCVCVFKISTLSC